MAHLFAHRSASKDHIDTRMSETSTGSAMEGDSSSSLCGPPSFAAKIVEHTSTNSCWCTWNWKHVPLRCIWCIKFSPGPNTQQPQFPAILQGTCRWSEHGDVEVVDWSDAEAGGPIHFFPEISPTADGGSRLPNGSGVPRFARGKPSTG